MIRVLHVLGGLNRGGAETMVMNLYRAVDKTKVQFDFIIHTDKNQDYLEEVKSMGARVFCFPRFKGSNLCKVIKNWDNFFKQHPEYKILHSHVRSYASLYLPIAKKYGLKTIIHSHSTSNGSSFASVVKKFMQFPLRYQADYLFGCSKISGEWLFGKKFTSSDKFSILQNAIHVDLYFPDEKSVAEYKAELELNDKIVYGHVGRLHPAKNHSFLLEVFKEIHNVQKNSILLIVGNGELKTDIELKIKELGLENSVKMLGTRADVPQLLGVMDCFLFPSKWEGLPVTVVEAQAASLPCLVSNTVTKEVGVSDLVKYLPIDKGTKLWADEAIGLSVNKHDVSDKIKANGFDVNTSAKWLEIFYSEMIL